jgi:hypothetical protein
MALRKQSVTPLIDIHSGAFAEQYEHGVWWRMHGDEQGTGPLPVSYFVINLRQYEERRYFQQHDQSALSHLGFFIGMYHGGILSPQTGQLRPDVTTLAILDHPEAKRGYAAGRTCYFHEPDAGYRYSESEFIEHLESLVINNPYTRKDNALTWYHTLGCLLGELSGQVFPETPKERAAWEAECRYWAAREAQDKARARERRTVLQEA